MNQKHAVTIKQAENKTPALTLGEQIRIKGTIATQANAEILIGTWIRPSKTALAAKNAIGLDNGLISGRLINELL